MDTLFILAVVFLIGCFIFRKRLAEMLSERKEKKGNAAALPVSLPEDKRTSDCKVMVFHAEDYENAKDMENAMESRLDTCIAGLIRRGYEPEVELHLNNWGCVYLIKYKV